MAYAPIQTTALIGAFKEKEYGKWFQFEANTPDGYLSPEDFPHRVWVTSNPINCQGWRYAKVLKTVAYIVKDEDENGNPIVEKWYIKDCYRYEK